MDQGRQHHPLRHAKDHAARLIGGKFSVCGRDARTGGRRCCRKGVTQTPRETSMSKLCTSRETRSARYERRNLIPLHQHAEYCEHPAVVAQAAMDERAFRAPAGQPLREQLWRCAAAPQRHSGPARRARLGARALERDFGSVAAWSAQFTAMAKAQGGGCGWTILAWSDRLRCLVNQWAADHAHGLPGGSPILALDMYEYAYHLDFGARAAGYVDQVMANLHWERIGARYRRAIGQETVEELFLPYGAPPQDEARISVEELRAALAGAPDRRPVLLDVCQPRDLPRRTDMLAGATMHAPAAVPRWIEELPRDRPIAVYCICGFQVSGNAVTELRKRGYDARALAGGITAWRAIGGPDGAARYLDLRANDVAFRAAREGRGFRSLPFRWSSTIQG